MSKKIDIVFVDKLDYKNLNEIVQIASIMKGTKTILPVIYRPDFQQVISGITRVKDAVGEFAFFGIKAGTNDGEILVDDTFIKLFNAGNRDICEGILAHEYGHYVDDCKGTRHKPGYEAAVKADITADSYGAEATTRNKILKTLNFMRDYYESLNDPNYRASILMLDERINKLSKY